LSQSRRAWQAFETVKSHVPADRPNCPRASEADHRGGLPSTQLYSVAATLWTRWSGSSVATYHGQLV